MKENISFFFILYIPGAYSKKCRRSFKCLIFLKSGFSGTLNFSGRQKLTALAVSNEYSTMEMSLRV